MGGVRSSHSPQHITPAILSGRWDWSVWTHGRQIVLVALLALGLAGELKNGNRSSALIVIEHFDAFLEDALNLCDDFENREEELE